MTMDAQSIADAALATLESSGFYKESSIAGRIAMVTEAALFSTAGPAWRALPIEERTTIAEAIRLIAQHEQQIALANALPARFVRFRQIPLQNVRGGGEAHTALDPRDVMSVQEDSIQPQTAVGAVPIQCVTVNLARQGVSSRVAVYEPFDTVLRKLSLRAV